MPVLPTLAKSVLPDVSPGFQTWAEPREPVWYQLVLGRAFFLMPKAGLCSDSQNGDGQEGGFIKQTNNSPGSTS